MGTTTRTYEKCGLMIMQVNAGRGRNASAEIRTLSEKGKIQIALVQEPYAVRCKVAGFGLRARTVAGLKNGEYPWAAIVVFDTRLTVMRLSHMCSSHVVCAQVDNGTFDVYLVCAYLQYSHDKGIYIEELRRILTLLRGKRVILCLDANARSPIWYSDKLDDNGEILEELILEMNLYVINEPNNPCTFSSTNGESNIDVSMASSQAIRLVKDWKVLTDWSTSDHRPITMRLELMGSESVEKAVYKKRFNGEKAKWEKFTSVLVELKTGLKLKCENRMDVVELAKQIRTAIITASQRSMPVKGESKCGVRWWTQELTELKAKVNKARKKFQKRRGDQREIYKAEYRTVRKELSKRMKQVAKQSFEDFITDASEDPWGFAYKLSCNKLRIQSAMSLIRTEHETTQTWKESAEVLLDNLFFYDTQEGENEIQSEKRERMYERIENPTMQERPFSKTEIDKAIKKLKNGKSPGWDRIEATMMKNS